MKAADWLNSYDVNTCRGQIIKEPLFIVLMLLGFFFSCSLFTVLYISLSMQSFICVTVEWKMNLQLVAHQVVD